MYPTPQTAKILLLNTLTPRQNGRLFQRTFSNAFSWMKTYEFWLKFRRSMFPGIKLTILQHWFRKWLGADQASSHSLNQWWLAYWRIYASLGLNELNLNVFLPEKWTVKRSPQLTRRRIQLVAWEHTWSLHMPWGHIWPERAGKDLTFGIFNSSPAKFRQARRCTDWSVALMKDWWRRLRPSIQSIFLFYVSWLSDHLWLRNSKLDIWPLKLKVKVKTKIYQNPIR